jgi:hypothetical protein
MVHNVLSFIGVFACFAAFSQKAEVVLSASTTTVEVGETIILKVETNLDGAFEIDNLPASFNYGGAMSSGMNYQMDYNTGDVHIIYTHSQNGTFTKPGTYKIGPAYIKKGGKAYQSNMITIRVGKKIQMNAGKVNTQQLKDPAFGVIQLSKSTIYEGEPIVVSAKVYSRFQPTGIGNYNTFIQRKGIEYHELMNPSQKLIVREERFKGNPYFTFEYDRNVIFPSGTGLFSLESFTMELIQQLNGYNVISNGANITIKPLPANAPSDFIGAVGTFSITRIIDTSRLKQGDVFKLTITIEGVGNIQNSLEPELNLPKGMIVYGDPVITKHISYGVNGGEGTITYEYNIQVSTHGKITLPATSISYFDPVSEKYVRVKSVDHPMLIVEDKNYLAAGTGKGTTNTEIYEVDPSELRTVKDVRTTHSIFGSTLFWTGLAAPMFCALFFVFFVKRRENPSEKIITKHVTQQKDKELQTLVAQTKLLVQSGENDAFFLSVENTLRKAFECKLPLTDDERILNKSEIYGYLQDSKQEHLDESVRALFRTCEESRFGFGVSSELRQPTFDQLQFILAALKV